MKLELAKVTLDSVNIYKEANVSETTPVVGLVYKNTYVIIDEDATKNNMYYIYYGDIVGYIGEKYATLENSYFKTNKTTKSISEPLTISKAKSIIKKLNRSTSKDTSEYLEVESPIGLWVHKTPDGEHVGILDYEAIVKVVPNKSVKGWYCIYFNAVEAYISDNPDYTSEVKADDKIYIPNQAVSYATVISPIGMDVFDKLPTDGGKVIGTLDFGQRIRVFDENSDDTWICIEFNGEESYTMLHNNEWCYIQEEEITDCSQDLLNFTASWEGFSATPYRGLDYQNETIGYGHVMVEGEKFPYPIPLSKENGIKLLKSDMQIAIDGVNKYTEGYMLKQNQKDALYDFAYNCGVTALAGSDLLEQAIAECQNNGYVKGDFTAWSYCDGKISQGLYNRRFAEYKMFVLNKYDNN